MESRSLSLKSEFKGREYVPAPVTVSVPSPPAKHSQLPDSAGPALVCVDFEVHTTRHGRRGVDLAVDVSYARGGMCLDKTKVSTSHGE